MNVDKPQHKPDMGSKPQRVLAFTLDDGSPIYRYPNGDLRRANGHWYQRPTDAAPVFDSERGVLASVRKQAIKRHREETYQGEVSRILKKRMKSATPEQAMAKLAGKQIEIALSDEERAADRLASTKYIEQAAGMSRKEQGSAPVTILQMTPEAIDRMYALSMGIPDRSGMPELPDEQAVIAECVDIEDAEAEVFIRGLEADS